MKDFLFGEVHFPPPERFIECITNKSLLNSTKYSSGIGDSDLITTLTNLLKYENSAIKEEEVLITPGAKQGIFYIVQLLKRKYNRVGIVYPCWKHYEDIFKMNNFNITALTYDDIYNLNSIQSIDALILINPNNPDGKVVDYNCLISLIKYCKKNDILLIVDEVYKDYIYCENYKTILESIYDINSMDNIIVIRSFSKSLALSGYRIGYIISNEITIKQLLLYQHMSIGNVPTFIQSALSKTLSSSLPLTKFYRNYYYRNVTYLYNTLLNLVNFRPIYPDGGLTMLIDVSNWAKTSYHALNFMYSNNIICSGINNIDDKIYLRIAICRDYVDIKNLCTKLKLLNSQL